MYLRKKFFFIIKNCRLEEIESTGLGGLYKNRIYMKYTRIHRIVIYLVIFNTL